MSLRLAAMALALVGALSSAGCATARDMLSVAEVRPWERDVLAGTDMQLVGDPMTEAVDQHMYYSKEASSGGGSVRGGGCGCN